jgi:hypothetical protein
MGFSCKDNINKLSGSTINQDDRDLGLSNIFNVKSNVDFCIEPFSTPLFYMSGGTKPYENIFSGCSLSGDSYEYYDCFCPSGFTLNPEEDGCISIDTVTATDTGSFYTVTPGSTNLGYANGTIFYEEITNKTFPLQNNINGTPLTIVDGDNDPNPYPINNFNPSGTPVQILTVVTGSNLWGNNTPSTGRLNNVGVGTNIPRPFNGEFIGFSKCIDLPYSGLYHIGVSGDNYFRVKLNGETIINIYATSGLNIVGAYTTWKVFPIQLNSGKNIIEMYGSNDNNSTDFAFGAEIYTASTATLTAATTVDDLGIVFTTSGLTGSFYEVGDVSGYTCPSGYALDTCVTGTPVCSKIIHTGITCDYFTCDGIHNLSEQDSFDLTFVITGGTDYTGYTGQFCYELYNKDNFILTGETTITPTPIYQKCIDFSAITSTTFTETLYSGIDVPILENEYKLFTYTSFKPNECVTNFTFNIYLQNPTFNYDNDWYIVTLTNPEKPLFEEIQGSVVGGSLYTQVFSVAPGQTEYQLDQVPNGGEIILNVNGITLTNGSDYTLNYSLLPQGPVIVTLNQPLDSTNDTLTVTYITPGDPTQLLPSNTTLYSIETMVVTGITTGTTASTVNILNYNDVSDVYEFFTQYDLLGSLPPKITLNGITLTENIDFFKSNVVSNKIIFHPSVGNNLVLNDVISVIYFKQDNLLFDGNLGKLGSNDVEIKWFVNDTTEKQMVFNVEITESTDTGYTGNNIITGTTEFVENQSSYSLLFEDVPVNNTYIYRVCAIKTYKTLTNDELITTECSDNGYFDLTSGLAIYSNI